MWNVKLLVPALDGVTYQETVILIFTKNQNQLVADYYFLFVVRSQTCFSQIY
jgi:hypothetical protein